MNAFVLALAAAVGAWGVGQPPKEEMAPPEMMSAPAPETPEAKQAREKEARERARAEARAKAETQRATAERFKARQKRPDNTALAERLTDCAKIVAGDLVLVRGGAGDAALLETIAGEVRKRGGSPLVVLSGDALERRLVDGVPADVDARPNELELRLASSVTAVIDVEADASPTELGHIPGQRLAARAKGVGLADELMRRRGVRRVELGHGLYPTAHLANDCAMSEEELSRSFWFAATADSGAMRAEGEMLRDSLTPGGQVVITNPNGTELKFKLIAKPGLIGDGTTEEGSLAEVRLPAGELVTLVAPGTAEGRIVVDRMIWRGREVIGLSATFRAGRLTSLNARGGGEYVRKEYEAAGPGRDQLAAVVIGLNPDLKPPSGVKIDWTIPRGVVSVRIGADAWAGGENAVAFSLPVCAPGSTLKVDGRTVIEEGVPTPSSPLPPEDEPASGADAPRGAGK